MAATSEHLALENIDITSPELYRDHGYPWAAWDLLRREAPVFRHENYKLFGTDNIGPVWVITKHADIIEISKNPETWNQGNDMRQEGKPRRHIIAMDPPEHAKYRSLVSRQFTPRAMARLAPHLEELSSEIIEDVVHRLIDRVQGEGHCDFVYDLAMRLPVYAICELLGVPREDAEIMFHWSNEVAGSTDPEYQNGRTRAETTRHGTENIIRYFAKLAEERRKSPKDDLMTELVRSQVDGQSIGEEELVQYPWLLLLGGNETTRNATSGGMLALIENPDEMARLRADPGIAPTATEEILRWVSPLIQFRRIATRDTVIRGQEIKTGDTVAMFYPSANRDEDVFENPYRFDVLRDPNPHLAFGGYGEHFCIGANLARLELNIIFRELLQRFSEIELDGTLERLTSSQIGGIKHMPVKFKANTMFGG